MSSEREIVKKLMESKDLDEAEFEANGSTYRCVFGKYYKDDEQITRDDYMKAKEGGSSSSTAKPNSKPEKKSYEDYTEKEFDDELDTLEASIDDLADIIKYASPYDDDARGSAIEALDDIKSKVISMEDYLTDDQYERSEEIWSAAEKAKDTEYEGDEEFDPYKYNGVRHSDFY